MSPVRLVILAILIYIGYLLIRGSRGNKKNNLHEDTDTMSSSDVLVEDPVCKRLVPKGQACTLKDKNKDVYFCSDACRKAYVPEKDTE